MGLRRLETAREKAEQNGWDITLDRHDSFATLVASRENVGDGYPHTVVGRFKLTSNGWGYVDGYVINNYGRGDETYDLGYRSLSKVLDNLNAPLKYKPFYEAFLNSQPERISEKDIASRVGVSERKIRNARIMGFVDDFLADRLCCKLLGVHPSSVYGYGAWVEGLSDGPGNLDQRIRTLYANGFTAKEIGAMIYASPQTVLQRLEKMGVKRRPRGRRKKAENE